jgi:hypothetical protein
MKRWAVKLLAFACVAICLAVAVYLTRDFWLNQLRAYFMGRTDLAAMYYQYLPKDIDTVEVFTLNNDPAGNPYGFKGDLAVEIAGHKTLTGNSAKEIVNLWGRFAVGGEFQAMCFDPAYGLQFKQNGKIYFQTAVCWHCSGYTVPVPPFGNIEYGFDSKSEGAQKLLAALERDLPLPSALETTK